MVSTDGFGFFSDFALVYQWAAEIQHGTYVGQYPYPLIILFSPITFLSVDVAATLWFSSILLIVVLTLKRESLFWIFYVPLLQTLFLGQLDPLFWLIYRSNRPAVWALLSLKPHLLFLVFPRIFSSKRNFFEFSGAALALHVPFLLIRPTWPVEWIKFLSTYGQNRFTKVPSTTVSGEIMFSTWFLPFCVCLLLLVFFRPRNREGAWFLANPFLLPYDYSLLMGSISKIVIPLSWLALLVAQQAKAGWPYSFMLISTLLFETIRERWMASKASPIARVSSQ